jgi:hypothetical protein
MPNNLDITLTVETLPEQVLESVQAYAPIRGADGQDAVNSVQYEFIGKLTQAGLNSPVLTPINANSAIFLSGVTCVRYDLDNENTLGQNPGRYVLKYPALNLSKSHISLDISALAYFDRDAKMDGVYSTYSEIRTFNEGTEADSVLNGNRFLIITIRVYF